MYALVIIFFFFFFNDTATTEIYTLPLHDALPIYVGELEQQRQRGDGAVLAGRGRAVRATDPHADGPAVGHADRPGVAVAIAGAGFPGNRGVPVDGAFHRRALDVGRVAGQDVADDP